MSVTEYDVNVRKKKTVDRHMFLFLLSALSTEANSSRYFTAKYL